MQNAAEGTIKETTYWWPRPGSDEPFEKTTYYTKVGDQICGVGLSSRRAMTGLLEISAGVAPLEINQRNPSRCDAFSLQLSGMSSRTNIIMFSQLQG